jgi:hypothetical protein
VQTHFHSGKFWRGSRVGAWAVDDASPVSRSPFAEAGAMCFSDSVSDIVVEAHQKLFVFLGGIENVQLEFHRLNCSMVETYVNTWVQYT